LELKDVSSSNIKKQKSERAAFLGLELCDVDGKLVLVVRARIANERTFNARGEEGVPSLTHKPRLQEGERHGNGLAAVTLGATTASSTVWPGATTPTELFMCSPGRDACIIFGDDLQQHENNPTLQEKE
jgi:hypothetical protein